MKILRSYIFFSNDLMRNFLLLELFILLLSGCKHYEKQSSFKELEFSYTNTFTTSFSIKFTPGQNVYVVQHFPKPEQTLKGVLTSSQRQSVDSFVNTIDFKKLGTLYYQTYEDGDGYQFHLKQDTQPKTIFVHSIDVPENLKRFAYWIIKTKDRMMLSPIDTNIKFTNISFFQPPTELPPSSSLLIPPKEK
jgi:hypothetical protein